jgi:predicted regulator of Ras-like GTPase activity (Roadblock/LC7/MglB family)
MLTEAELQAGPIRASVPGIRAGFVDASLGRLLASSSAFRFAGLSTLDGRSVAAAGPITQAAAARIAAMASSLLALSETFARETASGRGAYTTITAAEGLIVVVRVPTREPRFALCAGSDSSDNLGIVLRRTLDASESLAQRFDAGDS